MVYPPFGGKILLVETGVQNPMGLTPLWVMEIPGVTNEFKNIVPI